LLGGNYPLTAHCPTRIHRPSGLNELVGDFMQYFGVIYGLLLGLLAVATYQNYAEV
jgi:hypothetical protein